MALLSRIRTWLHRRPPAGASVEAAVTTATVVDVVDPQSEARVLVELAAATASGERRTWARVATLTAGPRRGTWFLPEVGDEVVVAFDGGDVRRPVVLGSMWSARREPPDGVGPGRPPSAIVTEAGTRVEIDADDGGSVVRLQTASGRHVTLHDGSAGGLTIEAGDGNRVELAADGVTVTSASTIRLAASTVTVAAASIDLESAMVTAGGVVKCQTMIADSVVASSYTPGAGNLQ